MKDVGHTPQFPRLLHGNTDSIYLVETESCLPLDGPELQAQHLPVNQSLPKVGIPQLADGRMFLF